MKKSSLLISLTSCLFISQAQAIQPVYDGPDGIKAKVFETNCLACHSSDLTGDNRKGAPDNSNYDTYSAALAGSTPAVNRGVIQANMPPSSSALPGLDEEQKQALKNWQALGFPEKNLPTIFSSKTGKLSLPQVYFKDAKGDISLKWQADMKLIPNQEKIQFELLEAKEIDTAK
ncbi:MAG: hypothetical protein KAH20_02450 [Methylococcales bacterium]|nr:hypothetical protein [Methylococcales bacterium]